MASEGISPIGINDALIRRLMDSHGLRLIMVVDSGNKSLHAWFSVVGVTKEQLGKFKEEALALGCDPLPLNVPCQWVRMPNGPRKLADGTLVRQRVIYFDPISESEREPHVREEASNCESSAADVCIRTSIEATDGTDHSRIPVTKRLPGVQTDPAWFNEWVTSLMRKYAITSGSNRLPLLRGMATPMLARVSLIVAERIVKRQFREARDARVKVGVSVKTHLSDLHLCWRELIVTFVAKFNSREQIAWQELPVVAAQFKKAGCSYEMLMEGFRIVKMMAGTAKLNRRASFPLPQDDLAMRLGLIGEQRHRKAGAVIRALIELGVLCKVRGHVPPFGQKGSAAEYAWVPFQ